MCQLSVDILDFTIKELLPLGWILQLLGSMLPHEQEILFFS
jgi:hypothetical protein